MPAMPMPAIISLSAALAIFPLPAPLAFAQNDTLGVPPMTDTFGTAPANDVDPPKPSTPTAGQPDAPAQPTAPPAKPSPGQASVPSPAAGSQ
jgi:hypothetical protein